MIHHILDIRTRNNRLRIPTRVDIVLGAVSTAAISAPAASLPAVCKLGMRISKYPNKSFRPTYGLMGPRISFSLARFWVSIILTTVPRLIRSIEKKVLMCASRPSTAWPIRMMGWYLPLVYVRDSRDFAC